MKQKSITNILTIGFALFAMFFGAGNIILPPIIGLITGEDWSSAVSGFTITAIIAPFLGILAVLFSGDEFTDLGKRINSTLGLVLATMIILSIGPLVAIPRTAATTFEVGLLPIWPNFNPIVSSVLFFTVTLALSISPSKVVDIIGKYLTPLLLILLTIMIVMGILHPLDVTKDTGVGAAESFRRGFAEGYQTMDVLASVIYAGIIIAAVKAKGYTSQETKTKVTFLSGAVATSCLLFIYGGLVYLGATSGYNVAGDLKRTELLLYISNHVLGAQGTVALSLCIALACLTTAIALVCATGTFFSQLTNGKVSYKVIVIATCVFSAVLAVNGVDQIIDYAGPFLGIIYPITLTLIVYIVLFGKVVKRKLPFVGAIATTTVFSLVQFYVGMTIDKATEDSFEFQLNQWIQKIPLYNYDVPWLLPSFVVFVLVYIVSKK
ncbi:branched-chain amino acid transport system II carrier protein [Myroides sp. WP-1]|uniref:branched-chain amino acid transport system II carrier protein n=1 Tax=Myroides sp. WP-1 TaxID=2759944 RepID=UPI0015FD6768|nr:branched-chain amino acid transport system II carrier protein [Myroides sp. WP-1]MBB1140850.1 branched-chain amino acid transport system II carrier protein [Myroides sp. WP-1]